MKKLFITLLALGFAATSFAQVTNDFESGNRAIDKNNCWQFSSTNVNASGAIDGKSSCQTGSLSGGVHFLISPWVKFTAAGKLSFSHTMSANNGTTRLLNVYLLDGADQAIQTLYTYSYPGNKTQVINAVIDLNLSGVFRIKWEFTGEGGSSKGTFDLISIPGEYSSDPTANDGTGNCSLIVTNLDTDQDGVTDTNDAYPTDPYRAYNNLYPVNEWGSLGFEDLWPSKGDYDFNDLVVDYQFIAVTDAQNEIVELKGSFLTRAIGASFHSAFGVNFMGIPSASVGSVTSSLANAHAKNYFSFRNTGVEAGQTNATIIVYDDAYTVLPHPGTGAGVNTTLGAPYVEPKLVEVLITLKQNGVAAGNPIKLTNWPVSNINFFLVVKANEGRGIEVHLPDYPPTDLADRTLFGTMDDDSSPEQGHTYRSRNNLPWVINVLSSFGYPIEKADIVKTHLKFGPWAETGGVQYTDWYMELPGYTDLNLKYRH